MQADRLPLLLTKHLSCSNNAHNLPDLLSKRGAGDYKKKDQPEKDSATFHPHPSHETLPSHTLALCQRRDLLNHQLNRLQEDNLLVMLALDPGRGSSSALARNDI
jgi:hypothetical protein